MSDASRWWLGRLAVVLSMLLAGGSCTPAKRAKSAPDVITFAGELTNQFVKAGSSGSLVARLRVGTRSPKRTKNAPVNLALVELKANGFLEEVNLQFFGPDFDITYDDLEG